MSADHKPEDDLEMKRIKNAGGKVTADGRVNGGLNLSRAIGGRVCPLTSDERMWQRARKVHLANHDACKRKAL